MIELFTFMALLHFPMVATRTNKRAVSLWCGKWPFEMFYQLFNVVKWNFEEILLDS